MYKLVILVLCTAALVAGQDGEAKDLRKMQDKLATEVAHNQLARPESEPVLKVAIQVLSELLRSSVLDVCPELVPAEVEVSEYERLRNGFMKGRRRRSATSQLEREILQLLLGEEAAQNNQEQQDERSVEESKDGKLIDGSVEVAMALVDDLGLPVKEKTIVGCIIGEAISSALCAIRDICGKGQQ